MKKTYVLVLLVLLVAFLSQSVVYATDNENDYQKVIELSREKLGNQRVTVQLMDGLNSYEKFYLEEGVESGYLIYDRDNGIFLEYSAEDSSPFGNSMGDKKYIGPTYYGTASSHYKKCTICNANIYCSSTATVISNTSTTHTVDCSACGYSKTSTHTYNSNNHCTVCGYHTTHTHLYTDHYAFYSSLQHKAYCSCGNYVLRAHLGLAQAPGMPIYCASCGYEMDDGE